MFPPAGKDRRKMKRDMLKIAGKDWTSIPERYQLTDSEYQILMEMLQKEKWWELFGILFRYGFQLGRRYEKKHGKAVK